MKKNLFKISKYGALLPSKIYRFIVWNKITMGINIHLFYICYFYKKIIFDSIYHLMIEITLNCVYRKCN